jgi:hypothetical protein
LGRYDGRRAEEDHAEGDRGQVGEEAEDNVTS